MRHTPIQLSICLLLFLGNLEANEADSQFSASIRPIFRDHCYRCHGATQQKGELRLDLGHTSEIWEGSSGPAWIEGNPEDSLLIQLLKGNHDSLPSMPYKKEALSELEIQTIEHWIDQGAIIPPSVEIDSQRHWAFSKPDRPEIPKVRNEQWTRNAIDFFILNELEKQGIQPSEEAAPSTLLRRLFLDLTGLPPGQKDLKSISAGFTEPNYQDWVNDLLASPHFGERWGRHWLDVARYADSNGYSIDGARTMWRYRDWVIQAVNDDMPFDQFTTEQIAGDLLPHATLDQIIATGFHRNTQINQEGGIDPEQFRMESIFDRMATTGAAFLGLTIGCAQCHDHKFDPVSQEEYYRMFAFFNNQDEPNIPAPTYRESMKLISWEQKYNPLKSKFDIYEKSLPDKIWSWEKFFDEKDTEAAPTEIKAIIEKIPQERSKEESKQLLEHFKKHDVTYLGLSKQVNELQRQRPRITTAMVLKERSQMRETHLLIKGDFTRPDKTISPGVPKTLHPMETEGEANRLDLAKWITSPENPLTARVIMNRMWQQYFGNGIVETENDFGTQGSLPSNPALLDWLAVEFMESGWSMKQMHRLITQSTTYRQSSKFRQDLYDKDPRNLLLGRQNRVRLESEIVRDVALQASGLLEPNIGGPSVHPPQPKGVMGLGQVQRSWKANQDERRFRRGMYTFFWRATPHPALSVFDSPDAFSTCTRRIRSNTPLQALALLNDPAFHEMAEQFALLMLEQSAESDSARVTFGFKRCTSRLPDSDELEVMLEFISQQRKSTKSLDSIKQQKTVWLNVARVLLNLDETITRE